PRRARHVRVAGAVSERWLACSAAATRSRVRDQTFVSKYGPWALIVGGSTGMGAEYARQLAAKGLSIVVLADPSCPPQPVADEVAAAHGVASRALVIDLLAGDVLQ